MSINREPFKLGDWGESDGIGECEELIKKVGGSISKDWYITLPLLEPPETQEYTDACRAVDYLISEWDYALEEWRKDV